VSTRRKDDMPVYEYRCKDCGYTFEVDQRIVDPLLDSCKMCGGSLERLISMCSFVLKGDGWYATEHPSSDRKKSIAKEKKSNGISNGTSNGTSDGTSSTKSESKDVKTSPSAATAASA
jgi:putative FmdB family regulatory protein